jgi:hypothetical protein
LVLGLVLLGLELELLLLLLLVVVHDNLNHSRAAAKDNRLGAVA